MSFVLGPQVVDWVSNKYGPIVVSPDSIGLGWVQDDKLVAGVVYEEFTEASIHATIVIKHGTVMTKRFFHKIFDYPFNQLGVDKIIVQANTANVESVHLAKRLGFTEEGMIKGAYLDGDRIILTMTKDECKWLKELQNENEVS